MEQVLVWARARRSCQLLGLSKQEKESGDATASIFALIIIVVFFLLVAPDESYSVPFTILLRVPLGLLGAIFALTFLPHLDNNIYAQIGLITLIGLAAKTAILIVEFTKTLRYGKGSYSGNH